MQPNFAGPHKCLNLTAFPTLSYRVRSLIIQQEKAQDREKLLLKFIKIMKVCQNLRLGPRCPCCLMLYYVNRLLFCSLQHLRKLNNFNSYLAILSALDSAPIRRLEWQKQTSEVRGRWKFCHKHRKMIMLNPFL